jgi:O-antigen/teichoic acid export membrane protein
VAVSDVFFGALSRARREAPATMPKIFARTAVGLSGVGIALALGLVLVAPPLFPFLFGNEWATAGLLAAAMAPMALAQTIVSPLSRTVAALEAQRSKLIYDVVAVSCTVLSIWLCHSRGMDLVNTMIVFAACRALTYVVYLLVLWVIVRRAAKELG